MLSGALFSRSPAAVPHAQSVHHNKRHVILKFNHHIVCFLKTILLNPKSEEFWTDRPITVPSGGVLPLQTQDHRPLSDLRYRQAHHCHWGSPGIDSDARVVLSCNALHLSQFSSSQRSPRCACLLVSHLEQQLFLVDSSAVRPSAANACWAGCWIVLCHASRLFEAWVKGKVMGNDVLSHVYLSISNWSFTYTMTCLTFHLGLCVE